MSTAFLTPRAAARFAFAARKAGRRVTFKRVAGEWIVGALA